MTLWQNVFYWRQYASRDLPVLVLIYSGRTIHSTFMLGEIVFEKEPVSTVSSGIMNLMILPILLLYQSSS